MAMSSHTKFSHPGWHPGWENLVCESVEDIGEDICGCTLGVCVSMLLAEFCVCCTLWPLHSFVLSCSCFVFNSVFVVLFSVCLVADYWFSFFLCYSVSVAGAFCLHQHHFDFLCLLHFVTVAFFWSFVQLIRVQFCVCDFIFRLPGCLLLFSLLFVLFCLRRGVPFVHITVCVLCGAFCAYCRRFCACMCAHIFVCVSVCVCCMCVCMRMCICMRVYTCMFMFICMYVHVWMPVYVSLRVLLLYQCMSVPVRMYVHVRTCMHVCM